MRIAVTRDAMTAPPPQTKTRARRWRVILSCFSAPLCRIPSPRCVGERARAIGLHGPHDGPSPVKGPLTDAVPVRAELSLRGRLALVGSGDRLDRLDLVDRGGDLAAEVPPPERPAGAVV